MPEFCTQIDVRVESSLYQSSIVLSIGKRCEEECPPGRYGAGCAQLCACSSELDVCDHITGECSCRAGFQGQRWVFINIVFQPVLEVFVLRPVNSPVMQMTTSRLDAMQHWSETAQHQQSVH